MNNSIIDALNTAFRGFLENRIFKTIINFIIYLNPVALAPQVWSIFTAPSIAGVSLFMWFAFAAIQTAMLMEGIRVKSVVMFWSMFISLCESIAIIVAVILR